MITDFELVRRFQTWEKKLESHGYKVSVIQTGFYVHNKKGTIVADVLTVDGLRGFAQGIEYMAYDENEN
jgi:P2-related tail formation protein